MVRAVWLLSFEPGEKRNLRVRTFLTGIGILLVVLVATIFIAPRLIDWNGYKGEITNQVEALTGRKLVIAGDVAVTILPTPVIVAKEVTFANDPRSIDADMVEAASLDVRAALGPLLGGNLQISKIVLVRPVIRLETFADGTSNWALFPLGQDQDTQGAPLADGGNLPGGEDGQAGRFRLDNFAVKDGQVIFINGASGERHTVDAINATLKAASLRGPFEAQGTLTVHGNPIRFRAGVEGILHGHTLPITVSMTIQDETRVELAGKIINFPEVPRFNGTVQARFASPTQLAALLGADLPPILAQPVEIYGSVAGDREAVAVRDLALSLGDMKATGSVDVALEDVPQAAVILDMSHVDLDHLLAQRDAMTATFVPNSPSGNDKEDPPNLAASPGVPAHTARITIPGGIVADLDMTVHTVAYRGEKVGPVRLSASLSNGEVTLSQLVAQVPGATDFAVFGFLMSPDGNPLFKGEFEANVGDTRGLARWLGLDLSAVPDDRLRRVEASAALTINTDNLQIADGRIAFDRTVVQGGITLAHGERLSFGAALDIDVIDLDPYLVGHSVAEPEHGDSVSDASGGETPEPVNPLALLSTLSTFDANIRAQAGEVIYRGNSIKGGSLDATVFNNTVTLRDFSVADVLGTRFKIDGKLDDLAGIPVFDPLNLDVSARSVDRLARFAGIERPVSTEAIGAIRANIMVNGHALAPEIRGDVSAAGGVFHIDGKVAGLPFRPSYAGTVQVAHPDSAMLARTFAADYRPAGTIGGFDLSVDANIGPASMAFRGIRGRVNQTGLSGDMTVRLGGVRPDIQAVLKLDELAVDPFLPAEPAGSGIDDGTDDDGTDDDEIGVNGVVPWPLASVDLDALGVLDAAVSLTAEKLSYGRFVANDATARATVANNELEVERFAGTVFGGAFSLSGRVDGRSLPGVRGTINFRNGRLPDMLGEAVAGGTLTLESRFDTRGQSIADMVADLNGQGNFEMHGVDVSGPTRGSVITGILGLLRSFGQLSTRMSGNQIEGLANVEGQFTVANGLVALSTLDIVSGLGRGVASGTVDLDGWTVDVSGAVDMTGSLLSTVLATQAEAPGQLAFRVTGPVDTPEIRLDTPNLSGEGGLPIPGLDKLDENLPGVGGLIRDVLGGNSSPRSLPGQQGGQPDGQTDKPTSAPKPQELLEDILKF